ncbi:23S rRNA methyltransferase [Solibacillus silvestris]|uniref:23S rRNA methyltransferase n=1 Tax=Solibacillus silvestris TaxID=76853 RepID=UPI003F8116CC
MRSLILLFFTAVLLAGCGDAVGDLKEAAAGINSKANEAASAISIDVHSIRAAEIEFGNQTFTINDLFKTILRDVQWYYDGSGDEQLLKVTGTWQNNGLFAEQKFSEDQKQELKESGQIEVNLSFDNGIIEEQKTTVLMQLNGNTLVERHGSEILHHFYNIYIQ